jgi:DNA-directed RNA polymerase subunit omega
MEKANQNVSSTSMIYPAIADLLDKVDSRYTLVIEVAKRARQLTAGSVNRTESNCTKPVSIAIHEIYNDKVSYESTKDGLK